MIWRSITFVALGSLSGVLGFWSTDRDPPVHVTKIEVVTPSVRPGGDLKIRYEVDRRADCPSRIQRVLLDGDSTRFVLQDIELVGAAGPLGQDTYISAIPIPLRFSPGRGIYRAVTAFVCNPIHAIWPVVRVAAEIEFDVQGPPIEAAPVEVMPRN